MHEDTMPTNEVYNMEHKSMELSSKAKKCVDEVSQKLTYFMLWNMDKSLDCQTDFRGMARFHGVLAKEYQKRVMRFAKDLNDYHEVKVSKSANYDDTSFSVDTHIGMTISTLKNMSEDFDGYVKTLWEEGQYSIAQKIIHFQKDFLNEIFAFRRIDKGYHKMNVDKREIEEKIHKHFEEKGYDLNFNIGS